MRIRALINKKRRCKIEGHMLGNIKCSLKYIKYNDETSPLPLRRFWRVAWMPTTPSTLPHQNRNLMDNGKWYRPKTWWGRNGKSGREGKYYDTVCLNKSLKFWHVFFRWLFLFIDEQKSAKGVRGTSRGGSPAVSAIIQKYNPCGDFKKPNVKPITHFHLLHVWL